MILNQLFSSVDLYLDMLISEKNLSPNTISAYKNDITHFIAWAKQDEIFFDNILVKYISEMNCIESTKIRRLTSIRQWFEFCARELNLNIKYIVPRLKKKLKIPKMVSHIELSKMKNALNLKNYYDIRLLAMLEMLYSTGLRIQEFVSLHQSNINLILKGEKMHFYVIGKGGKERAVFMNKSAIEALKNYIPYRSKFGKNLIFLWPSRNSHVTRQSVFLMMKKLAVKVGINSNFISPHKLRHRLGSDLLQKDMNLVEVQKILGHANINTTEIYTHIQDQKMYDVVKKYHPLSKNKISD